MRESRALELVDGGRVDPVVLAEDEAAQERRRAVGRARGERALGPLADPIEGAGQPRPSAIAELDRARGEHPGDPEPLEIAALELRRRPQAAGGGDGGADVEVGDGLGRLDQQPPRGRRDPSPDHAAGPPRNGRYEAPDLDPPARREAQRAGVDRGDPQRPDPEAGGERRGGHQADPGARPERASRAPARGGG